MRLGKAVLLSTAFLVSVSCGKSRFVTITPPRALDGASVLVDGRLVGTLQLPQSDEAAREHLQRPSDGVVAYFSVPARSRALRLEKPGYQPIAEDLLALNHAGETYIDIGQAEVRAKPR